MKNKLIFCLLALAPLGCTKESGTTTTQSSQPVRQGGGTRLVVASDVTVTESAESRDRKAIRARASELFAAKDYEALEKLAGAYRSSKECYADGFWKLSEVYSGIALDDEAPESEWKKHLAELREWVKARPNAITARVALADALVTYGWKARGSGFANSVPSGGWQLLNERLTEAVHVIKDAGTLSEDCPRRVSLLMTAAMGLGIKGADYEAVFQKATNSYPQYTGYYYTRAYYLMERWYGKKGELAAFMKKSADDVGGDEGDLLYARMAWYLQGISDNIFIECDLPWERVDKGFHVMEKRFPDSTYVKNGHAYMSVCGSTKIAAPRALVAALGGKIDPKVWRTKENYLRMTKDL